MWRSDHSITSVTQEPASGLVRDFLVRPMILSNKSRNCLKHHPELYKRRSADDKLAKQNAINTVFQKAIDAIDVQARKNGGPPTPLKFEDFPPMIPTSKSVASAAHLESSMPLVPPISRTRVRSDEGHSAKKDYLYNTTEAEVSEQSQETSASYPPSSKASGNCSKRSDTSYNRSSASVHSQQMSVTSIGSRRSTRARGNRKVIIESDDEGTGRKGISEDEFEDSDVDVEL
jgi:hypothetical protein